jgi:tRNA-specific 2-thiouridylase
MNALMKRLKGRRVFLGLSGGVDSAVAALLLRDGGADVHALHMTNWEDDDGYCTAANDLQDARRICERLDIPFHHVNFAAQYREQVFARFLDEYRAGRTPNPDVLCNREIKFGVFRAHARRLGGELIATGHYARTRRIDGRICLEKALDRSKDQSYFLHAVSEEALAETVFPLGDLQKSEVRSIAREHGLQVHNKKDSTGICFIGERPFREFLATYLRASPGPIRTPDGVVVGEHHGLAYYTLGQRQGLGIGGQRDFGDEPWYVAAKDNADNALIVVQGEHPLRFSEALLAAAPHWINGEPEILAGGRTLRCGAKLRYRHPDQACEVRRDADGQLVVAFSARQADVSPGQFIVFYAGDRCLGGAVIERTIGRPEALLKTG